MQEKGHLLFRCYALYGGGMGVPGQSETDLSYFLLMHIHTRKPKHATTHTHTRAQTNNSCVLEPVDRICELPAVCRPKTQRRLSRQ
jgi:hypothetical protein